MMDFIIFFLTFYLLIVSIIGFGFFFQKVCFANDKVQINDNIIYSGFYGLFIITLLSLFTNVIMPHNFLHNIFVHSFGILFFLLIPVADKKRYIKMIFLISFFSLSALLISKTHDDFSYYHLPITKYLTEHKVIFGTANLSHGYKLLSSLFFLNSTLYLPFIEYYSFHFSSIYFLIFFNFFVLKEIYSNQNHEILKYLYLFAFVFFNLSFNRLAEFGTDKAGQLLIVVLIIKTFEITCLKKKNDNFKSLLFLIPLFAFCFTLKTYFIPYLLFAGMIFFLKESYKDILKYLIYSRSFVFFIITLLIYFFFNFASTGCILSPIAFTCFGDNFDWAYNRLHYENLSNWLEQWAKAGAGPNFRVENPNEYIENFNWVSRWFEFYFMGKVKDQIFLFFASFLLLLFLFKKIKINSNMFLEKKNISIFYLINLIIFFIWFNNHPQLRYGGYSAIFFIISLPLIIFLFRLNEKRYFEKKLKLLIILIILVFNFKNFSRINKEFEREDIYKFNRFPFFALPQKIVHSEISKSGLTIYKVTNGHCWNSPSPCYLGTLESILETNKVNNYYFIINK